MGLKPVEQILRFALLRFPSLADRPLHWRILFGILQTSYFQNAILSRGQAGDRFRRPRLCGWGNRLGFQKQVDHGFGPGLLLLVQHEDQFPQIGRRRAKSWTVLNRGRHLCWEFAFDHISAPLTRFDFCLMFGNVQSQAWPFINLSPLLAEDAGRRYRMTTCAMCLRMNNNMIRSGTDAEGMALVSGLTAW
jgi:hypothetical protein